MGFFKAYDMRGTFGKDFDLALVRRVGEALPKVVGGERWLVGRDCRTTSDAVRSALVEGLEAAGAAVTDIGLCTTPMVYYHTAAGEFDGSVMVTASHNPPTDNGLKVSKKTALPVGYANGLNEVERLATGPVPTQKAGTDPQNVGTGPLSAGSVPTQNAGTGPQKTRENAGTGPAKGARQARLRTTPLRWRGPCGRSCRTAARRTARRLSGAAGRRLWRTA